MTAVLLATAGNGVFGRASNEGGELTLAQFRAQVRSPRPGEDAAALRQGGDAAFLELLGAQGKEEAARQSLDRISGWRKAAEARLAAQQVSPLDMELLRFAEAKAAARLARVEAERRRALQEANRFVGREPASSLTAVASEAADRPATEESKGAQTASAATSAGPSVTSEFSKLESRLEKELLPQAKELLGKAYQSYLFGGIPLSELLWLEEEVHDAEWQHHSLVVEAEREAAGAKPE
ncbi:MAG: hypothetical protein HY648_11195 [Acidobacteria bacterium]|nr:hypothetical protein [Acidobacteriota bacterium]